MKTLVALILLCAGVWIFHTGWLHRETWHGQAQAGLVRGVNAVDGGDRLPAHSWYMLGGTVLALAGAGLLVAGKQ